MNGDLEYVAKISAQSSITPDCHELRLHARYGWYGN
jgi:hypothetical protein